MAHSEFAVEAPQRQAWTRQIADLQTTLRTYRGRGHVLFEYTIPRLGRRIDDVLILDHVVFVLEFKVGESRYLPGDIDQVWDYALDLKNFHEPSHRAPLAPVLIATDAIAQPLSAAQAASDGVYAPWKINGQQLAEWLELVLTTTPGPRIDPVQWVSGHYRPTPTIVEAARALYAGHAVADIARSDAGAVNLATTSGYVCRVIEEAQRQRTKAICLLTGVPGAGKTLVGLDVATSHMDAASALHSVFLSGNGPLVAILREALARDQVRRESLAGRSMRKSDARRQVETFVQNVHHFRDDGLIHPDRPPTEHVSIFDEAQRAWTREQTSNFMRRKKGHPDFDQSEPEFLIGCMDRHPDWAVVLCLVGGGQEINTGEAGISAWIETLREKYPHWHVHLSPRLTDSEYGAGAALQMLDGRANVSFDDSLHLSVSMRSFRAERVSEWVKLLLDVEEERARGQLAELLPRYPIRLTRQLASAKQWLRTQARGSERYGLIVSSQAQRLKPHAIDVRAPLDPVHWFLDEKQDVRSSYYLEDAATEFHVQGLELDWTCVVWDADLRMDGGAWSPWSFVGDRWQRIHKPERRQYLTNAYRVLLTRARQGMVLVVPDGDAMDPTRDARFFDGAYDYLRSLGLPEI